MASKWFPVFGFFFLLPLFVCTTLELSHSGHVYLDVVSVCELFFSRGWIDLYSGFFSFLREKREGRKGLVV